jgi:hypothetical protein
MARLFKVFLSALLLWAHFSAADIVKKTIELEWEEVPDAASYVVKLVPAGGGDPLYFTAKEAHLSEDVPVGNYELRIRSRAKDEDIYSPWSDPMSLEVAVKELQPLSPPDKTTIEAHSDGKLEVEFSWTPIEKVKEYHIKIWTDEAGAIDKPLEFTTRATKKSLAVRAGHQYFWQVSFDSATDTAYAQTPKTFSFTLAGSRLMPPTDLNVKRVGNDQIISWTAPPDAKVFKVKLEQHFLDEKEFKSERSGQIAKALWNAGRLKPGPHRLEITASAKNHTDSPPAVYEFLVKPSESEIDPHLSQ